MWQVGLAADASWMDLGVVVGVVVGVLSPLGRVTVEPLAA